MRFNVELLLENEIIPKDKNRIILSFLKHNFSLHDKNYYYQLYEATPNKIKSFTFSLYMGNCKFLREEILIPDKRIILNFSTYDMHDGITFYNAIMGNKGREYLIKNNTITISRIHLNKEKPITDNDLEYKVLSPILVREHTGDNCKTWYHSLNDIKGQEVFMNNLKYQLKNVFGESKILDIEEVAIEVLNNKEVKVKHYGIEVLGNICNLKVKAKPYILDYIYKSGVGSQKSSGFGMLDLV